MVIGLPVQVRGGMVQHAMRVRHNVSGSKSLRAPTFRVLMGLQTGFSFLKKNLP